MNAALACGIVLAICLIIALLTNNAYNRAKEEKQTRGVQQAEIQNRGVQQAEIQNRGVQQAEIQNRGVETHQGFTPRH